MTNKEAIEKLKEISFMTGYKQALNLAIKALEERPHGEWTTEQGSLEITCSVCNKGYFYHPKNHFYYNYCPTCGADMRGEEE